MKIIIILISIIILLLLILIILRSLKNVSSNSTTNTIKKYKLSIANAIVPKKYLTPESLNLSMQRLSMFIDTPIPESFSWREKLGDKISPVRNQKSCGDCSAHSSISALADRYAVHYFNNNIEKAAPDLSVLWVVSNLNYFLDDTDTTPYRCSGFNPYNVVEFFEKIGCKLNDCWPVSLIDQNLDNFPEPPILKNKNCCFDSCIDSKKSNTIYKSGIPYLLYHPKIDIYSLYSMIQSEIMMHGPVIGAFKVFNDFGDYWYYCNEDDVYIANPMSGYAGGWHSVEVVGWGKNSKGLRYWEIKNSWGTEGGFNKSGYAKIAFSIDHPIESSCFLDIPYSFNYGNPVFCVGGMIGLDINVCPAGYYCPYNSSSPQICTDGNYCQENSLYQISCPKNSVSINDNSNCCYNKDVLYKLHDFTGLRLYDLPYDDNNVGFQFPCCNGLNYDPNNPFKDAIPIPFDDPKYPGWTAWKCNK
jgi:hypothetical protein